MAENIEALDEKVMNILVLGETGVGKSTWINSFANYVQYDSLAEAERNELVTIIPTSFTITDDNYEERRITMGSDGNEVQAAGQSATQRPRTYTLPYSDLTINIIDTPGVGDVRGPSQDAINLQMIMDHLACYKAVHAICILLKPNNPRITVFFEFCIKHLLTHLHKDAIQNIVFCFTNARNTFYRPGETLPALRQLISNFQDLTIPLDKSTMYCLDNESIKFLAAVQEGINLEDQRDVYAKSWEVSSNETQRLLKHIYELKPHLLQNTLSLNDARRVVLGLTQPLADIGKNIQKNIMQAKRKQTEVMSSIEGGLELEDRLHIPVVRFRVRHLDRPYQVCTASKCCRDVKLVTGEQSVQHFCRKPTRKSIFRFFKVESKNCPRCFCPKSVHMDISYEITEEIQQVRCHSLEERIKKLDISIENIRNEFIGEILNRIKLLETEQAKIMSCASQFAYFVKANAIAPYNDSMVRYLELQIETAKLNPSQENLQLLLNMKKEYEAEVAVMQAKMASASSSGIQCSHIPLLKQELMDLPMSGPQLRDILEERDRVPAFGVDERVVEVKRKDGKKLGHGFRKLLGIPELSSKRKSIKVPKPRLKTTKQGHNSFDQANAEANTTRNKELSKDASQGAAEHAVISVPVRRGVGALKSESASKIQWPPQSQDDSAVLPETIMKAAEKEEDQSEYGKDRTRLEPVRQHINERIKFFNATPSAPHGGPSFKRSVSSHEFNAQRSNSIEADREQDLRDRLSKLGMKNVDWQNILIKGCDGYAHESKWEKLERELEQLEKKKHVQEEEVFKSTQNINWDQVRVVVLGYDPTTNPASLGYSADTGAIISTQDAIQGCILDELKQVGLNYSELQVCKNPCLNGWTTQGCLCINSQVFDAKSGKHTMTRAFLDGLLTKLDEEKAHDIVIVAFGFEARSSILGHLKKHFQASRHRVICSSHPIWSHVQEHVYHNTLYDVHEIKPFLRANKCLHDLGFDLVDFLGYQEANKARIEDLKKKMEDGTVAGVLGAEFISNLGKRIYK